MTKAAASSTTKTHPGTRRRPEQAGNDLLTLRAQLARAEKEARRAPTPPPARPANLHLKPVKAQREADLAGIDTTDHSLARAHARLRDAVYDGKYTLCPHAIGHARAEGFLEHDIIQVLVAGRVRAVYPEDRRWLVCGYFEACGVALPLHAVVEHQRDGHIDVVTAFVPKHPHHIISRARLAVMLRYDDEKIRARTAAPGNRPGNRSKGKWKKGA
ncbi:hypothetical protein DEIPH_ctg002orf0104 [Deinococcus phoenicis]|uniref:DUF4258 domain-containing protein n=1 Tax=Deinococcus phoenicis TaxID=1476583 RepID=A0A016QV67_9DEIO|nr:DUF4258 domain-containing protein [Deinococcus phoenicis]EYB69772.1 hypothetical protein DEIPH_ctg002orf0104 [Deinococcus phoenicis]